MISEFLKSTRDLIQAVILLLILIVVLKLFSIPDTEEIGDWMNYRRAIANIERKGEAWHSFSTAEGLFWRGGFSKNEEKAIELLCVLAKKRMEEAELLLLIYDKGVEDCAQKDEEPKR